MASICLERLVDHFKPFESGWEDYDAMVNLRVIEEDNFVVVGVREGGVAVGIYEATEEAACRTGTETIRVMCGIYFCGVAVRRHENGSD